ncbi:39S ribosomal protein L11, mitochondrial, partial [Alligator sinensis]|uniref:Large ribosomal subunit protein uL11m n=1 Tax=Alligator sinensis TaxID=38654 RepID=A0A3Q0H9D4_ALLSI
LQPDRTYDLIIHPPTTSYFLLAAAGIEKGASQPGHEEAGLVSLAQLYEIAQVKIEDPGFKLRGKGLEDVVRSLMGSARSLGLRVVPQLTVEECTTFRQRRADELAAQAAALKEAEAAAAAAK